MEKIIKDCEGQQPLFQPATTWNPPTLAELPDWSGAKRVALDVETYDPLIKKLGPGVRRGGYVAGVSFAIEDGPAHYLPIRHGGGDNLPYEATWDYLRQQLNTYSGTLVGANLGYDLDYCMEKGCTFEKVKWFRDVQVAEPLIYELRDSFSLEAIAGYHGIPGKDEGELREACIAWGLIKPSDKPGVEKNYIWALPGRYVGKYAIQDVRLPLQLLRRQERIIEDKDLQRVFDLESKVLPILTRMRRRGVRVDLNRLQWVEDWSYKEGTGHLAEVFAETGIRLNMEDLNNSDALAKPLLHIGVEVGRTPKGKKYSVDADLMKSIDHPVAKALLKAKKMHNLKCKFANSVREHLIGDRIHATINQLRRNKEDGDSVGVAYGRCSSTDPNLQQQPGKAAGKVGEIWRSIYIPDEGKVWGACDYAGQELRWLVHLAELLRTPKATEAGDQYRKNPNLDHHSMVAEICKIQRPYAKCINFGIIYGKGERKLCEDLGLPTATVWSKKQQKYILVAGDECKALLKTYHRTLPFAKKVSEKCMALAAKRGYIRTLLGRTLHFEEAPESTKDKPVYDWTYKALNRWVQGTSADQTKKAMVDCEAAGHELQLQVHDEVDLSVTNEEQIQDVARIMANCMPSSVPFKVDCGVAANWGEAK